MNEALKQKIEAEIESLHYISGLPFNTRSSLTERVYKDGLTKGAELAIESAWVDVNMALPEPEDFYLVAANKSVFKMYYGLMNEGQLGWFYDDEPARRHMQPTHWMPLPTPPNSYQRLEQIQTP